MERDKIKWIGRERKKTLVGGVDKKRKLCENGKRGGKKKCEMEGNGIVRRKGGMTSSNGS